MEEKWFPVPDSEGYSASSLGRVKGPRCILKPSPMKNGYLGVKIKGKGTTMHAAVCAAFHGPRPSPSHTVNHKNGKRTDNVPQNLEWMTHLENMRHAVEVLGAKFGGKARLPPAEPGPEPGSLWQTLTVTLYVPTSGRCDQHATVIDGQRVGLLSATEIGRRVAAAIHKRPSGEVLADYRRGDDALIQC